MVEQLRFTEHIDHLAYSMSWHSAAKRENSSLLH